MNEFNEPPVLPPFGDLYADSAPSDDALARMLDVAVDPSTPDPGDSLIPGSEEVSLDEFDEGISLDDGAGAADHDPSSATTPGSPTTSSPRTRAFPWPR